MSHWQNNSYGFRPDRNASQAVMQVNGYVKQNRKIAIDVDLSKFIRRQLPWPVDHV